MIDSAGMIYQHQKGRRKYFQDKDLDGDSGVGQAPEFPFKSLSFFCFKINRILKSVTSFVSLLLMIAGLSGLIYLYGPIIFTELNYRFSSSVVSSPKQSSFSQLLTKNSSDAILTVPDPDFSIVIPKIRGKAKIIANVDPINELSYNQALIEGVAHAQGTMFPGQNGNIYLFAHSTNSPFDAIRLNAVFYLLRELESNDEIYVFYQGVKHKYLVTDKKIVDPTDISVLSSTNQDGKERLILQTCYPPGTRNKRLLIFAEKNS